MPADMPALGIDFGTSRSAMAWFNPASGQPEVLRNAEGEEKTPSLVYYGDHETLVGTPAEQLLEDPAERGRVVRSIKREIAGKALIALPNRQVGPVEVAAEILRKLKRDAEQGHFQQEVERAVLTVPAAFTAVQRRKLEEAARLAGFTQVQLLEEPVAAALAYLALGQKVGGTVLVYDLGGGTFDTALLAREAGGFHNAIPPQGLARCGGDDFDRALYTYCNQRAREQLGRGITLDGSIDPAFLRLCRQRKEALSTARQARFSAALEGGAVFTETVERATFEDLIGTLVEQTVELVRQVVDEGAAAGYRAETVALVGGSSRLPLVQAQLGQVLGQPPRKFERADLAVALGAAYQARRLWQPEEAKQPSGDTIEPERQPTERIQQAGTVPAVETLAALDVQTPTAPGERTPAARDQQPVAALDEQEEQGGRAAPQPSMQHTAVAAAPHPTGSTAQQGAGGTPPSLPAPLVPAPPPHAGERTGRHGVPALAWGGAVAVVLLAIIVALWWHGQVATGGSASATNTATAMPTGTATAAPTITVPVAAVATSTTVTTPSATAVPTATLQVAAVATSTAVTAPTATAIQTATNAWLITPQHGLHGITGSNIDGATFVDARHGWMVGSYGTILHTDDGGATWTTLASGTNESLNAVIFVDASHGWAVGDHGTILHTDDGGRTWLTQRSGGDVLLFGVAFSDRAHGWVVGDNGTILHTADGGRTWTAQHSGFEGQPLLLGGIACPQLNLCWVVGDNGTILHTADGGRTWTLLLGVIDSNNSLDSVVFTDATHGWAAGTTGIVHTDDGGRTWTTQYAIYTNALNGVAFTDASHGWAVGESGTILHTDDGGATWTTLASGTDKALDGVTFADATHGWAVGHDGTILRITPHSS